MQKAAAANAVNNPARGKLRLRDRLRELISSKRNATQKLKEATSVRAKVGDVGVSPRGDTAWLACAIRFCCWWRSHDDATPMLTERDVEVAAVNHSSATPTPTDAAPQGDDAAALAAPASS